jgi:hypothetical protein
LMPGHDGLDSALVDPKDKSTPFTSHAVAWRFMVHLGAGSQVRGPAERLSARPRETLHRGRTQEICGDLDGTHAPHVFVQAA